MTKVTTRNLCAADLLKKDHPVHQSLVNWVAKRGGDEVTKRQASKFLQVYPNYRSMQEAA